MTGNWLLRGTKSVTKSQARITSENKENIPRKQVMRVNLFQRHWTERDIWFFSSLNLLPNSKEDSIFISITVAGHCR